MPLMAYTYGHKPKEPEVEITVAVYDGRKQTTFAFAQWMIWEWKDKLEMWSQRSGGPWSKEDADRLLRIYRQRGATVMRCPVGYAVCKDGTIREKQEPKVIKSSLLKSFNLEDLFGEV